MAGAIPIIAITGLGLEVAGQLSQAKVQADTAKTNAKLASLQAHQAELAGKEREQQLKRKKAQLLGRQRTLFAKSGVSLLEGSPLLVMADSIDQFNKDIGFNKANTDLSILGFETQSKQFKQQSSNIGISGLLNAGGTLLTGIPMFNSFKKPSIGSQDLISHNHFARTFAPKG